jgi:hypothetical protein
VFAKNSCLCMHIWFTWSIWLWFLSFSWKIAQSFSFFGKGQQILLNRLKACHKYCHSWVNHDYCRYLIVNLIFKTWSIYMLCFLHVQALMGHLFSIPYFVTMISEKYWGLEGQAENYMMINTIWKCLIIISWLF